MLDYDGNGYNRGRCKAFNTKLVVYSPARTFVRPNGDSSIHVVTPDVLLLKADSRYTGTDYILDHVIHLLKSTRKNNN